MKYFYITPHVHLYNKMKRNFISWRPLSRGNLQGAQICIKVFRHGGQNVSCLLIKLSAISSYFKNG